MPARNGAIELDAGRALVMSRTFDAPRALVFAAWTDPGHVAQWWGPAGFENTRCDLDLRVGGAFRLFMRAPDSSVHCCSGVFREIVRPERLVYENYEEGHPCGAGIPPGAVVTVLFEDEGAATKLTISTEFPSSDARLAARAGGFSKSWLEALERLARAPSLLNPR